MTNRAAPPRAFAALAWALLVIPIASPPKAPAISEAGRAELSRFLQDIVDRHEVPGIVALVASPERELYVEAFGEADVAQHRKMTTDAIFRIASMTKPVTSVAAMMLFDQGLLGLDDPLVRYLPDYTQPDVVA